MVISFDLDGTLIPSGLTEFPVEDRNILQRLTGVEPIRKGTGQLFKALQSNGYEVGIYTTSYRSPLWIRLQLLSYGIKTDFIINETRNRKELRCRGMSCSKFPPAFNIDVHVDDSAGVEQEGRKFNFKTILIMKEDMEWLRKVTEGCSDINDNRK